MRIIFTSASGSLIRDARYPIFARRIALDGTGEVREIKSGDTLWPGIWEFRADAGPNHYVAAIDSSGPDRGQNVRNDDWFRIRVAGSTLIRVVISSSPASIRGVVKADDKPLAGAPVFLEWFNPDPPNPRLRLFSTRSDAFGNYAFDGLAPGRYRVLSSYDFDPSNPSTMSGATNVTLAEGEATAAPLQAVAP